jgi:hypothetical protein
MNHAIDGHNPSRHAIRKQLDRDVHDQRRQNDVERRDAEECISEQKAEKDGVNMLDSSIRKAKVNISYAHDQPNSIATL